MWVMTVARLHLVKADLRGGVNQFQEKGRMRIEPRALGLTLLGGRPPRRTGRGAPIIPSSMKADSFGVFSQAHV